MPSPNPTNIPFSVVPSSLVRFSSVKYTKEVHQNGLNNRRYPVRFKKCSKGVSSLLKMDVVYLFRIEVAYLIACPHYDLGRQEWTRIVLTISVRVRFMRSETWNCACAERLESACVMPFMCRNFVIELEEYSVS